MTVKQKTNITMLVIASAILLMFFLVVYPIFTQIKRESEDLITQRKEAAELEIKTENIRYFQENLQNYQPNLQKMQDLLVDASEPIEFIKFLEAEAKAWQLSIEMTPPSLREDQGEPWPSLEFSLNLKGSFQNFLGFLVGLESGPYLVEPLDLNIRQPSYKEAAVTVALTIKIYAK